MPLETLLTEDGCQTAWECDKKVGCSHTVVIIHIQILGIYLMNPTRTCGLRQHLNISLHIKCDMVTMIDSYTELLLAMSVHQQKLRIGMSGYRKQVKGQRSLDFYSKSYALRLIGKLNSLRLLPTSQVVHRHVFT